MPVDPLIAELWPPLAALHETLAELDGRTVTVTAQRAEPTQDDIDKIHAGLLRKRRHGDLGLG